MADTTRTPLQFWPITVIVMIQLCESLQVNVLFPYLAFMIEDYGVVPDQIGTYAGWLAAVFCGSQFLSSYSWGWYSDKKGRKPAILLGTVGALVGCMIFAFASTYSIAILGRVIAGGLSGNLGVLKSHLAEITDDTNRGKGFSYMSVAWASGTIIAPLLGGLLCKPAVKYPFLFSQSSLFAKYPYALPNVVIGCFQILTAILCFFIMKETRFEKEQPLASSTDQSNKQPPRVGLLAFARSLAVESRVSRNSDYEGISTQSQHGDSCGDMEDVVYTGKLPVGDDDAEGEETRPNAALAVNTVSDSDDEEDAEDDADTDICLCVCCCPYSASSDLTIDNEVVNSGLCGMERGKHIENSSSSSSSSSITDSAATTHSAFTIEDEDDDDDDDEYKLQGNSRPSSPSLSILTTETDGAVTVTMSSSSGNNLTPVVSRPHSHRPSFQPKNRNGQRPKSDRILYRKGVVLACAQYGLLAMVYIVWDETIPLHLKLDTAQKGYGYSSNNIGLLLSASGAVMLLFTSVILPILTNFGKLRLFNVGVGCAMPIAFAYPVLAYILSEVPAYREHTERVFFFLAFITVLKNMTACTAFTASMIMLNNSVEDKNLGKVNGLGQSVAALARAVGPAAGGILWSLGIQTRFIFINFLAVFFGLLCCCLLNAFIPPSLDHQKKKKHSAKPPSQGSLSCGH